MLSLGLNRSVSGQVFDVRGWSFDFGCLSAGTIGRVSGVAIVTLKYGGRLHKVKVDGR